MATAERSRAPGARVSSFELRQLWESAHRGAAIRLALQHLNQVLAEGTDLTWLVDALRIAGLSIESTALQVRLARRDDATVQTWERTICNLISAGDPWWGRELLDDVSHSSAQLDSLRIESELAMHEMGCGNEAPRLIAAWVDKHGDEPGLEAAVDWWVRCGRIDEARPLIEAASGSSLWRARLAIWRNLPAVARPILATLAPSPQVRCLEAIADIQESHFDNALSILQTLLNTDVQGEASSWLATVLRKRRHYGEALHAADAALAATSAFDLVAWLERQLSHDLAHVDGVMSRAAPVTWFRRILGLPPRRRAHLRQIRDLEAADDLYVLGLKPSDSIEELDAALAQLGGNHTLNLTTVRDGKLTSLRFPPNPRHLGARLQLVLWTRGIEAVRGLYREFARRTDGHPLLRIYEGELELWVGSYDSAEKIFRDILAKTQRVLWAWIGLGASVMYQQRLKEAQEIWEKGLQIMRFAGPTLYVYRGECYRRQGKVDLARRELEEAVRQKPQRLSAHINLALLEGKPDALQAVVRHCEALVPLLMEELQGAPEERLEGVLHAMRGNRSSNPQHVSYHLWGRLWRPGM